MNRPIICQTDDPRELELRERIVANANVVSMSPPQPTFGVALDSINKDLEALNDLLKGEVHA